MKSYKVIQLPANKSVTGKDVFGVVRQAYNVGPDHITRAENLTKEQADRFKSNLQYYSRFPKGFLNPHSSNGYPIISWKK
jgi:hypothetical protein